MLIPDNIASIRNRAFGAMVDSILTEETNSLYGIVNPICTINVESSCLYLYLYAIDGYKDGAYNHITEIQYISIITKLEELTKICCNE